jgi:hypothetical protein
MNTRKLVIAAGAATVAGALSATLVHAAGAGFSATGSGTSTTLSAGGSAFGGSANGSLGNNGGSLQVSLPAVPSTPDLPSPDGFMDSFRSGAQEFASDLQAAITSAASQAEANSDTAQAQGKDASDDMQAQAESALDNGKAQLQAGIAGGEAQVDTIQGQVGDGMKAGQKAVTNAVTQVQNGAAQAVGSLPSAPSAPSFSATANNNGGSLSISGNGSSLTLGVTVSH